MTTDNWLGHYLNDHLADLPSCARLIECEIARNTGTRMACCLRDVLAQVRQDQARLRDLLRWIGAGESTVRKIGGWFIARLARARPCAEGDVTAPGTLVQSLELLTLDLHRRVALWSTLHSVGPLYPALVGVDFAGLKERAQGQHDRVEQHRLEAAYAAFALPAGSGDPEPGRKRA